MSIRLPIISHIKACKSIKATFNPWLPASKSAREFYHYLFVPKLRNTNDKCKISCDIRSDQVEPQLEVVFNDDSKALFKTTNLTLSDINRVFHRLSKIKFIEKDTNKEKI